MNKKSKAEFEKELVNYILLVGLKGHAELDEKSNTYYEFRLENGEFRYCTNMSTENLKKLGIGE